MHGLGRVLSVFYLSSLEHIDQQMITREGAGLTIKPVKCNFGRHRAHVEQKGQRVVG